jgi:hypothetical protein
MDASIASLATRGDRHRSSGLGPSDYPARSSNASTYAAVPVSKIVWNCWEPIFPTTGLVDNIFGLSIMAGSQC